MRSKQTGFATIAVIGTVLLSTSALAGTDNIGLATVPLTLTNNTGASGDLYLTILGLVGNTWYSVSDTNGDVAAAPDTTAVQSYSIDVGSAQTVQLAVPQLVGARIYVSVGQPLMLPGGNGVPGAPAGWVASDPNYDTQFDWIEYTWVAPSGSAPGALGGNTTQVDMFGLALGMSVTGDQGTLSSGFETGSGNHARVSVLSGIANAGSPWNALIVNDASGNPLRAISPYHGIENKMFPSDYLQSYLDQAFSSYPNGGLSTTSVGASFTGSTSGGVMNFTNTSNGESFQIAEPSTYTALTGAIGPTVPPSDPTLTAQANQIGAQLQATLLRTALLADGGNLTACNTASFYANAPVDQYANVLHQNALDGHTYAFGYDDECGQSSYINVTSPTAMTLSVGPIN